MGSSAETHQPIAVKLTPDQKRLIDQAAHLRGQSLSDYAIQTLVEDARRVVEEAAQITLGNRDRDEFLALLDADDQPNQALVKSARDYLATRHTE